MAVVLICTIYLVIRDGSTDVVENLLMTIFITSASLLGLPAIAGAWGKAKIGIGRPEPTIQENSTCENPQEQTQANVPDCDNCYYKNKAVKKKSE